jgi:site-specific recombinase XerD
MGATMGILAKNSTTSNLEDLKKTKITLENLHQLFKEYENKDTLVVLKDPQNRTNLEHLFTFILEKLKTKNLVLGKSNNLLKERHEPAKTWMDSLDTTINMFLKYLENDKGYALSSRKASIRNLKCFTEFIADIKKMEKMSLEDFTTLTMKDIVSYENYLIQRHNDGEIEQSTIYKYLYMVHLFVDFLRKNKKVIFIYNVPPSLKKQGKRTNAYATTQEIIVLLETAEQFSSFKIRDMCILLLIMELGCRPIEVTGLCIDDLRLSESLITLYCVKSGQRTLKISKDLTRLLRKYLEIRKQYNPKHENVFINVFGEPLSRNGVSSMILGINKKAFGDARINAKGLRHTYATNALDNLNDFEEVSKSMGHLHWASTEYYVHKSIKRLLKNSLPFNPLHQLTIGDEVNGTD